MERSERKRRRFPWKLCIFLLFAFAAVAIVAGFFMRGPSVPDRAILTVRIGDELAPRPPSELEALFLGPGDPSVPELYRALAAAAGDPRVMGVLLDIQGGGLGFAEAREVRSLLAAIRRAGKRVVAFGDDLSLRAWYLASAADVVALSPAGSLRLTGIGLKVMLFGGLFEKLGIKADLLRIGKYKTAYETFTGTELSEESREALRRVVDVSWEHLAADLAGERKLDAARIEEILGAGPVPAQAALEQKLVDALVWRHALDEYVKEKIDKTASPCSWRTYAGALGGAGARVAYLPLAGAIMGGFGGRGVLAADAAVRQLTALADDPSIAAVIVRVDSPGGDALASRRLYQAVREVRKKKPVVMSLGSTAASGGYYVAAAGDYVVAHPFTITGSIGIFGGKMALAGVLDKIGVTTENFRRGELAGLYDPFAPMTEAARKAIERELSDLYERFLLDVAEGRELELDAVRGVAEGRVWTGSDALEHKLIDAMGGMAEAVEKARELARIAGPADLVVWPPSKAWYQELFGGGGEEAAAPELDLAGLAWRFLGSGHPFALAPVTILRD